MCFSPAQDECGQVQGQSWILAMVVIQVGANDYPELPRLGSAYFHLHARSRLRISPFNYAKRSIPPMLVR